MAKESELEPLHDADLNITNISKLSWTETILLEMMDDQHLKNAALKLMGFSNTEYDAPEDLKHRWLRALRMEWEKRLLLRKSSFNK